MISAQFGYAAPAHLSEAVDLISQDKGAKVLAGGHSLLLDVRQRKVSPSLLIDLRKIRELSGIRHESGKLKIGAMTTCRQISEDAKIGAVLSALAEAASQIGDAQVRSRSTLGGNLAQNDPAGDLQAVALALDAFIHVVGPSGGRAIPAESFFVGPYKTDLTPDEIITSVDFPVVDGSGSAYEKFKNPANGYAVCGVAARVVPSGAGGSCRVAVSGALRTPGRLADVERELARKKLTPENVSSAVSQSGQGLEFLTDLHASAEYRKQLMHVLTERALMRAGERAALE
jgi:aerobic carbon-monoxide dehydrogenase medium subunit